MRSRSIRQPVSRPSFATLIPAVQPFLSVTTGEMSGSDFLPVGCLVFISVQEEACGFFSPAQCRALWNGTIVTLIVIFKCCLNAFSILPESSPQNTHDRRLIQNTTPPHTQYDSQSWADCAGSLMCLVGEVLAERMLLDLCFRAVNIKHFYDFLRSDVVAKAADLLPSSKLDIFYAAQLRLIIFLLATSCLLIVASQIWLRIRLNLTLCLARFKGFFFYLTFFACLLFFNVFTLMDIWRKPC